MTRARKPEILLDPPPNFAVEVLTNGRDDVPDYSFVGKDAGLASCRTHCCCTSRMALIATDWEPVVRRALSTADNETALRLRQRRLHRVARKRDIDTDGVPSNPRPDGHDPHQGVRTNRTTTASEGIQRTSSITASRASGGLG